MRFILARKAQNNQAREIPGRVRANVSKVGVQCYQGAMFSTAYLGKYLIFSSNQTLIMDRINIVPSLLQKLGNFNW